jgi:hypothetical protein
LPTVTVTVVGSPDTNPTGQSITGTCFSVRRSPTRKVFPNLAAVGAEPHGTLLDCDDPCVLLLGQVVGPGRPGR